MACVLNNLKDLGRKKKQIIIYKLNYLPSYLQYPLGLLQTPWYDFKFLICSPRTGDPSICDSIFLWSLRSEVYYLRVEEVRLKNGTEKHWKHQNDVECDRTEGKESLKSQVGRVRLEWGNG
jgi:hypothetical protein